MSEKKEKCLVVGGGLVGSLQAIYLAKRGYQVELYERSQDVKFQKKKKNLKKTLKSQENQILMVVDQLI